MFLSPRWVKIIFPICDVLGCFQWTICDQLYLLCHCALSSVTIMFFKKSKLSFHVTSRWNNTENVFYTCTCCTLTYVIFIISLMFHHADVLWWTNDILQQWKVCATGCKGQNGETFIKFFRWNFIELNYKISFHQYIQSKSLCWLISSSH